MTAPDRPSPSLANNPRLGSWLSICPDGRVLARSGKVELGQGVLTALSQVVAEELDVAVARVEMVHAKTGVSPDEAYTAGSMSIQHSGDALRQVCAQARAIYLDAAAGALGVPPEVLSVIDGDIVAPDGRRTSYWALADDARLARDTGPAAPAKSVAGYTTVGRSVLRRDLPGLVFGRARFIHDLRFPGQLHGRVVRPPSRGAVLVALDDTAVRALAGVVRVVRDGTFLGVLAEREEVAVVAAEMLGKAGRWAEADSLPAQAELDRFLLGAPAETTVLHDTSGTDARPAPAHTITASFMRPYLAHASLAPSCGVAIWQHHRLHVWSHSQGIYKLRLELARAFGLELDDVVVKHGEGAGCYGHNAADDAAYDAALLACAVPGRHVQVVWSRPDELAWSPLGPAMVVKIDVELDGAGQVQHWQHQVWSNGHTSRPGATGLPPLLGSQHRAGGLDPVVAPDPPIATGGGSGRNAVPSYQLPSLRVSTHRLQTMPLRTSALRALGAHLNVYAIESVIDQLAQAAGVDPLRFRLAMLPDERARAVLDAAAEHAGWGDRLVGGAARGRGLGFARYKNLGGYCAVVAEVEAEAQVRVTRLTIAVDVGLVVNPDGVRNQVEGGALQAASWTTLEQVRFDRRQVTSQTWEDYPILTFEQAPAVQVVLLDRPELPSVGSGEVATGPTAAAIGNAVAAALGVRVRTLPLTPDNVIAAFS